MFTRNIDYTFAKNQKVISHKITAQTKEIEEQTRQQGIHYQNVDDELASINRKLNEINSKVTDRTITIPYNEYQCLLGDVSRLSQELEKAKEILEATYKEYEESFKYHDIQVRKYGDPSFHEVFLPFKDLDEYFSEEESVNE